jgi:hypothetical protein
MYVTYRLLFKNYSNFKQIRWYFIFSICFSILIPLGKFSIDTDFIGNNSVKEESAIINSTPIINNLNDEGAVLDSNEESTFSQINWISALTYIYLGGIFILILKLLIQLLFISYKIIKSNKVVTENCVLLYMHGFKNTFSFFRWVFVNDSKISKEEQNQIVLHEIVHVTQYHSIDLLIIELLTAVMWFNPLIWMMKKTVQLVHEYLADEGVLKNGVDKFNYQALLLNQVAEERLISISSCFNQSLIKKRIVMMNSNKLIQSFKSKILLLIPIISCLIIAVACVNGEKNTDGEIVSVDAQKQNATADKDVVSAVALPKMNVLYVGVDNPVQIAVSGYESSELSPTITNGSIRKVGNGNYIIKPRRPGNSQLAVWSKGVVLEKKHFRVKALPDPIALVGSLHEGDVTKVSFLEQTEIVAFMPNFDFDLSFEVISYRMSLTSRSGFSKEFNVMSKKISVDQKDVVEARLSVGAVIIFDEIIAKGPDGSKRTLAPLVFKII